jgi:hypothetical protein
MLRNQIAAKPKDTLAVLRARIAVRLELARQAHPESQEYMRLQQQIAELEREVYEREKNA